MTDAFVVPFLPRRPRSVYRDRIPGKRRSGDQRGWKPGWPAGMAPEDMAQVTVTRPGDDRTFRVRVDRRLAELTGLLLAMMQEVGYPLIGALEVATRPNGDHVKQGGVSSYSNRPIKTNDGTRIASEHSRGLALDVWSRSNPQRWGQNVPFSSTWHPLAVRLAIAAGFEWGGHFWDLRPKGTYIDAMHLEYRWSPEDVANSVVQLKAEYLAIRDELEPEQPPEEPEVTPAQVKVLQAKLNEAGLANPPLVVDGVYGPLTESAVVAIPASVDAQVGMAKADTKEAAKEASTTAIDAV